MSALHGYSRTSMTALIFLFSTLVACNSPYTAPDDWHPALVAVQAKAKFPVCVPTEFPESGLSLTRAIKTGGGFSRRPEIVRIVLEKEEGDIRRVDILELSEPDEFKPYANWTPHSVRGQPGYPDRPTGTSTKLEWNEQGLWKFQIHIDCARVCLTREEIIELAESMVCSSRS